METDIPDSWFLLQCIPCFYRFETSFLNRSVASWGFLFWAHRGPSHGRKSIHQENPNGNPDPQTVPNQKPMKRTSHRLTTSRSAKPTAMISSRSPPWKNRSVHRSRSRWLGGGASFFSRGKSVAGGGFREHLGRIFSSPEKQGKSRNSLKAAFICPRKPKINALFCYSLVFGSQTMN